MRATIYVGLVAESVRAILRHRVRSALTALGIAIGIASVVWVVAIGQAGSSQAEHLLADLGDNLVWVEAGSRNVAGVRTGTRGTNTLTIEDANAIVREVDQIERMSPQIDGKVTVVSATSNWNTTYRGVSPAYFAIKKWSIASGEQFGDEDVERSRNVCAIGETVRVRLFGDVSPLGQMIRVNGAPFEVIAVLAPKGQSGTGQDQDDTIILPWTTTIRTIRPRNQTWLDDILLSAKSPEAVAPAASRIQELMRQRHRIAPEQEDDFNIRHPEELIKAQLQATETFALLLIVIASVSLLVGGIGIMNVMLASVTERTKEIGVRLAVGAKPHAVRFQFLSEAIVLCSFGGTAGIVASLAGSFLIQRSLGWPLSISPSALVVALLVSIGVGTIFGYFPARRASSMDPIEALKSE